MPSSARKSPEKKPRQRPVERAGTLEPLAVLEFSRRGTLTLPPKIRRQLGGKKVMLEEDELGRIYLAPVRTYRRYTAAQLEQIEKDDELTDEQWDEVEKRWGQKLRGK